MSLSGGLARKVGRSKTHRKESPISSTVCVDRCPTGHVLKQTDRPNPPIRAKIEPMPGAPGHANQIARLNLDCHYRSVWRMHVKQPMTRDDESHFVFVMPVFPIEFRKHHLKPWCFGADIDQIGGNVTAAVFQFCDFLCIGAEDFICR